MEWLPAGEGDTRDLWVIFRPQDTWYLEDVISLRASGENQSGESVDSGTYRFQIESEEDLQERESAPADVLWQPQPGEDFDPTGLDLGLESNGTVVVTRTGSEDTGETLAAGLDAPFTIGPEQVYEIPQRVWLPLPAGTDANAVQLYYYHPNGLARDWYPAEQVEGWLVPGSTLYLEIEGTTYLGFLVRHAGIVQLRTE